MPPSLTTAWFGEFKGEQFQHLPPSKNYNPEDPFADPVAKLEHRDAVVREKFVHVAKCQVRTIHCPQPQTPKRFLDEVVWHSRVAQVANGRVADVKLTSLGRRSFSPACDLPLAFVGPKP